MTETGQTPEQPKLYRTVDSISRSFLNPETQTPMTQFTRVSLHSYVNELLNQPSPPDTLVEFKNNHGVFLPVGSLWRGGMKNDSSDIDFNVLYDGPQFGRKEYEIIICGENPGHPRGLSFVRYYEEKLALEHPDWYAARVAENSKPDPLTDAQKALIKADAEAMGETVTFDKQEGDAFIYIDAGRDAVRNSGDLAMEISKLSALNDEEWKTFVGRGAYHSARIRLAEQLGFLPALFITDSAIETHPGALLHHQQKMVRALADLAKKNPDRYRMIDSLGYNFREMIMFGSTRHGGLPDHYTTLIRQHASEHGGSFAQDNPDKATTLLEGYKRELARSFPTIDELKKKFLPEAA